MKASRLRSLGLVALLLGFAFFAGRFTAPTRFSEHANLALPTGKESLLRVPVHQPSEAVASSAAIDSDTDEAPPASGEQVIEKLTALLSGEALDHAALSEVLKSWVARDPTEAMSYLVQGPREEYLLRWVVKAWSDHSPEEASAWLAGHADTENYDYAIEGLTHSIQEDDPESALKWAQLIEDPEVKTRVVSLAGYQQFRHDPSLAYEALLHSGIPPQGQEAIRDTWQGKIKVTAKRNSQNISSVVSAATAAGHTFDMRSKETVVQQIREGIVIEEGTFKGEFFGVPNITETEAEAAMAHLRLNGTVLAYSPEAE